MTVSIIMIVVALAGSAFISAAESALLSARVSFMENQADAGDSRARAVLSVLERYESFFATILLFGNLFNIIVAIAASNLLVATITGGETNIWTNVLATALATVLVYMVGELTPKTIGAAYAENWSLAIAHIIMALIVVSRPIVWVFTLLPAGLLRLMGISDTQERVYTSGELSLIIDRTDTSEVDPTHGDMIENLLKFHANNLRDPEVRVHTSEIIWLNVDDTVQDFLDQYGELLDSEEDEHRQMPGFLIQRGERPPAGYWYAEDQIAGVVYLDDVLRDISRNGLIPDKRLDDLTVDAFVKSDDTALDDVLREMINDHHDMVVSVNGRQQVNGVVTLKGLLELMRGDEDDLALAESGITPEYGEAATAYLVPGELSVERTRLETGLEIPLSGRYTTIAGFFIDNLQRPPSQRGDSATYGEWITMVVEEMDGNRIDLLKILNADPKRPTKEEAGANSAALGTRAA